MESLNLILEFLNSFQESDEQEIIWPADETTNVLLLALEGVINLENEITEGNYNLTIIGNDNGTVSLWKNYDYVNMPGAESLKGLNYENLPDLTTRLFLRSQLN